VINERGWEEAAEEDLTLLRVASAKLTSAMHVDFYVSWERSAAARGSASTFGATAPPAAMMPSIWSSAASPPAPAASRLLTTRTAVGRSWRDYGSRQFRREADGVLQ
jgi:hypothetical protein